MSDATDTPAESTAAPVVTIAGDGRAAAAVRRAKGFGGLAGFALAGFGSHLHGAAFVDAGGRALVGGVAGYVVAWLAAVTVWRSLLAAQAKRSARQALAHGRPARSS